MSKEIKKAIAFFRVANAEQAHGDISLDLQKQRIYDFARKQNIEIVQFREAVGGARKSLTELYRLCEYNKDIQMVLVTSIDRISRDMSKFIYWSNKLNSLGVSIKPVGGADSAVATLMELISVGLAAYDGNVRSEMVKKGLQRKAYEYYKNTKLPLGYSLPVGSSVPQVNDIGIKLRSIFKAVADEDITVREGWQRTDELITSNGKNIVPFYMLVCIPFYVGYVQIGDRMFKKFHEPLMTVAQHYKLIHLLERNDIDELRQKPCKSKHAKQGMGYKKSRGNKVYTYYRCTSCR